MNLRIQLALALLVIVGSLTLSQVGVISGFSNSLEEGTTKYQNLKKVATALTEINLQLIEFQKDTELAVTHFSDPDFYKFYLEKALSHKTMVDGLINQMGASEYMQNDLYVPYSGLKDSLDLLWQSQKQLLDPSGTPSSSSTQLFIQRTNAIQKLLLDVTNALSSIEQERFSKQVSLIKQKLIQSVCLLVFFIAIAMLLIWRLLDQRITKPIVKISKAINEYKKGNNEVRVDHHRSDEMGKFVSTFNELLDRDQRSHELQRLNVDALKNTINDQTVDIAEKNHELKISANVFDRSMESTAIVDSVGKVLRVNQAFTRLTDYRFDQASEKFIGKFFRDTWANTTFNDILEMADTRGSWEGEFGGLGRSNSYLAWLMVNRIQLDGKKYFIVIFSDITKQKYDEDKIWKQANFDDLTNLPNRAHFKERIERAIENAERNDGQLFLVFVDLDDFKRINDTLGHTAGDNLLIQVAKILRKSFRTTDLMARIGGDEFAIMLEGNISEGKVGQLVKKLNQLLSNRIKLLDNHFSHISGSIGIAKYPSDAKDYENLIRCADTAMYRAKSQGKNQFAFYTADMNDQAIRNLMLDSEMRLSTEDQFQLYLQPIVNAAGKPISCEALLRWIHPTDGLISPGDFIPVAEESGFIQELGQIVIQKAIRLLSRWHSMGISLSLSINISPKQIGNPETLSLLMNQLLSVDYDTTKLVVEITENTLMANSEQAQKFVHDLRSIGVKISLDDFGTGYSSLAYLRKYQVDNIKIDRCFIDAVTYNRTDVGICESVIALGDALNITVVAEGVENKQQLDKLAEMGCEKFQGYYFSVPVPIEEFERKYFSSFVKTA